MLIEFQTMELEELDNKILIKICDGCYDNVNERIYFQAMSKHSNVFVLEKDDSGNLIEFNFSFILVYLSSQSFS